MFGEKTFFAACACLCFGASAQEGRWEWQNPPLGTGLTDLQFIDSENGWAAGDRNTVLHTTDGGLTWDCHCLSYDGLELFALVRLCFLDNQKGWILGIRGPMTAPGEALILHTADGGQIWGQQHKYEYGGLLVAPPLVYTTIHFTDANNGWVQAPWAPAALLRTSDGGETWNEQFLGEPDAPYPRRIKSMSFIDQSNGWAVSDSGIHRTSDGGANWELIFQSSPDTILWDICFADTASGWVMATGVILHTADGGHTWQQQYTGQPGIFLRIDCSDSMNAWAVGRANAILHTVNGGQTWLTQAPAMNVELPCAHFINSDTGWAAGIEGEVFHTTDGGISWTQRRPAPSGLSGSASALAFVDSLHGWAVGGGIRVTTDGGRTWTAQTSGTSYGLGSVSFADENHGWVAGCRETEDPNFPYVTYRAGVIRKTSDGGESWSTQLHDPDNGFNDICFVDTLCGWAVGDGAIVHTEDGGTTWEEQYSSAAGGWFRVVFFTDRNNGWVGWGAATLLHTTDGGASWTTQATGSFTPVECIHFIDSATGWAVSGAYVYNTTDAGASWARSSLQIATHQNVHAVHFTDAQNGWAVSDSGIHRTSDGGKTWINQQRLSNERLYDVYFPDADHGWAVGSGATILHYNTSPASCARAHDTRRSADGLSVRVASNSAKSLIIAYSLKTAADMRLDVFAISGRKIATLEQGFRSAGTHRVVWQNSANNSKKMAAGIYYCALRAKTANRSMVETSSVIIAQ